MVKAKELWITLCDKYDYRFFAGVPFEGLKDLFTIMDPDFMHYVPAADELIALRLAAGSRISGFKSGIILEPSRINRLETEFNIRFSIPVLIMTTLKDLPLNKGLYTNTDISKVMAYIEKSGKPGTLLL